MAFGLTGVGIPATIVFEGLVMTDKVPVLGNRKITDGNGGSVDVTLHIPEVDEHGSFYCEYSLNGLSWTGKTRRAYGIDAIQAVYLVTGAKFLAC